jgi:putative transposase
MSSHDFVERAARKGIALNYIEPGEPNQNAYIERFNRTYRTEMLDSHLFRSMEQVREVTEHWLGEYREYRPHDSFGKNPPRMFMLRLKTPAFYKNQLPP